MAVTIKTNARGWREVSSTAFWTARCVWDTGTALYAVVQDTGATPKVRVMKADSRTAPTTWSEQDSADNKAITNVDFPFSSWLHTNGDLHVVVFTATNTLTHYIFDTDTDQWATGNGTVTTGAQNERSIRVAVDASSLITVSFTSSADDADLGFSRWDGASWTVLATGILGGNSTEASAIVDSFTDSLELHYFVIYSCVTAAIRYQSFDFSPVTLGTLSNIELAIGAETIYAAGGRYNMYDDAGTDKVIAAYIDLDALDEAVITLESAASTSNVSSLTSIEATTTSVGVRTPVSTAVVGGTPYAAWWDDASSGTIKYSTKSGGSWAAETDFATSITRLIEIVPISTDGLMVVYQSGSDVVMDWIVAPATNETGTATVGTASAAGGTHTGLGQASETGTATVGTAAAAGGSHTATAGATGVATVGTAPAAGGDHTGSYVAHQTGTTTVGTASAAGGTHTGSAQRHETGTHTVGTAPAAGGDHVGSAGATGITTVGTASATGGDHTGSAQRHETGTHTASDAPAAGGDHEITATVVETGSATVGTATATGGTHTGSYVAHQTGEATVGTATAAGGDHTGSAVINQTGTATVGTATAAGGDHTASAVVNVTGEATVGTASADGGNHVGTADSADDETGVSTVGTATAAGGTHIGVGQRHETGTHTTGTATAAGGDHTATAGATGVLVTGTATAAGGEHTGSAAASAIVAVGTATAAGGDHAAIADALGIITTGTATAEGGVALMFIFTGKIPTTVVFDRDELGATFDRDDLTASFAPSGRLTATLEKR